MLSLSYLELGSRKWGPSIVYVPTFNNSLSWKNPYKIDGDRVCSWIAEREREREIKIKDANWITKRKGKTPSWNFVGRKKRKKKILIDWCQNEISDCCYYGGREGESTERRKKERNTIIQGSIVFNSKNQFFS